jgi:hypothetical protein
VCVRNYLPGLSTNDSLVTMNELTMQARSPIDLPGLVVVFKHWQGTIGSPLGATINMAAVSVLSVLTAGPRTSQPSESTVPVCSMYSHICVVG